MIEHSLHEGRLRIHCEEECQSHILALSSNGEGMSCLYINKHIDDEKEILPN